MKKKLCRDTSNKRISGVCSGIANYFNIDVTIVRLIWALFTVFTAFFAGVIAYIVCALVIPEQNVYNYSDYEQNNNSNGTTYYNPPTDENK